MRKDKKTEVLHTLIHSTYQMMASIVYGFGIYSLLERGYSSSLAGLCFSLVSLFSIIVTPIISNYLDNTDKITVFDVITVSGALIFCLYIINFFLDTKCLLLSIIFILANGIHVFLDSIVNSVSSKIATYGIDVSYTSARAIGSISYGVMCAVFGYISEKTSYLSVIIGGLIFSFFVFLLGFLINKHFKKINTNDTKELEKEETISFKEFVKNNVLFFILCLFITGFFIGYTTVDNFMILVVENVGGTSKDMGYLLAYKAALEGIAILVFPLILKKVKLETTLFISALGFVLKQAVISFAPNLAWLYIAQTFQMISFSFITPGMIEFVNKYLKKREVIRGVSLFTLTVSIGSTVSSVSAGLINDAYGVPALNLFALIITVISAIGFCFTLTVRNSHNSL